MAELRRVPSADHTAASQQGSVKSLRAKKGKGRLRCEQTESQICCSAVFDVSSVTIGGKA